MAIATQQQRGIGVDIYLPNIAGDDLDWLLSFTPKITTRAPRFGGFLMDMLTSEQQRRVLDAAGREPREAEFVRLDALRWTNSDVAEALRVADVAADVAAEDHPTAAELLYRLDHLVRLVAAHRLERFIG